MYRTIIAICLLLSAPLAAEETQTIHVASGKYQDYYHFRFEFTPVNCELTVPFTERKQKYTDSNEYTFSEGGQFEIFIRKTMFPVSAPHADWEFLILRMPWTSLSNAHANRFISEKRKLFDRIQKMKTKGKGNVEVTVELNPYVTVIKKQPLTLELSERNIFFRQAYGQYIDYAGSLKQKRIAEQSPAGDGQKAAPEE